MTQTPEDLRTRVRETLTQALTLDECRRLRCLEVSEVLAALDPHLTRWEQAERELTTGRWRCFHCDEVFTDEAEAALHFGDENYVRGNAPLQACRLTRAELEEVRRDGPEVARLSLEMCRLNEEVDHLRRARYECKCDQLRHELDSKEGERLVEKDLADRAERALTAERDRHAAFRDAVLAALNSGAFYFATHLATWGIYHNFLAALAADAQAGAERSKLDTEAGETR